MIRVRAAVPALVALALAWAPSLARAETIAVPAGADLQAALDAAEDGDVLQLEAGRYRGDLDFGGRNVTVRGVGPKTVLRGTGDGPVVRFDSGEGRGAVLDGVTVRGGRAERGGGILVSGADPVIVRCVITRNRASSQGSGIWIGNGAAPLVFNNLIVHNRRRGGDPHGVEIVDAAPVVVNNTIARHDSNGLILRGDSPAIVWNNVFSHNGARVGRSLRGRGICDFSGGVAELRNNLFHRNRVAAILRGGKDWRKIRNLENQRPDALVSGNRDGAPGFRRAPAPGARGARPGHFRLRATARARDAGHPDSACDDRDGSPNDIGHTGGPYAGDAVAVPTGSSCGTTD